MGDITDPEYIVDGRHLLFGGWVDNFFLGLAAWLMRVVFEIIGFAIEDAHVIIIELLFLHMIS